MRNFDKEEVLEVLNDIDKKLDDVTKVIEDARVNSTNVYLARIQSEVDKVRIRVLIGKNKFSQE